MASGIRLNVEKRLLLMRIRLLIVLVSLTFSVASFGQNKIYNPKADAKAEVKKAIELAAQNGKHVFVQIGGNWCGWCIKFHNFVSNDAEIKGFVNENFEVVKVNYGRENRNEKLLAEFGFPQRFGFPVFVVLDSKGNRIHTQNSAFLEKDAGYDRKRVLGFFKHWSPAAVNPELYTK